MMNPKEKTLEQRVDELEALAKAVPRTSYRPWWAGNASHPSLYLATMLDEDGYASGWWDLMDFRRWGFNGGQGAFLGDNHFMHDAKDHLKFQVGNPDVRGHEEAKSDHSVYRYDIVGIDNPWAELIAAGADSGLLLDLIADWRRLRHEADDL